MRHISTAIVGTAVAGYVTPVAASVAQRYLAVPDVPAASMGGMVAFVLGLTGMSLCDILLKWARRWRDGPPPPFPPLPPDTLQ